MLESQIDEAKQLVRSQAPRALNLPGRSVIEVTPTHIPFLFAIKLDDGSSNRAFVVDRAVVTTRGLDIVARYLRAIDFLHLRNLTFADLSAVLENWGELPNGCGALITSSRSADGEPAALSFGVRGATATYYCEAPASAPPRPPGVPGSMGGNPISRELRARLSIKKRLLGNDYELHWTVEVRQQGGRWQPYTE
jgi:hypothetical protein